MTEHDWALVIQGPMVSIPPPHSWWHDARAEHERDGRVSYAAQEDCSSSIVDTVTRAESFVGQVVLSTWSDDVNAGVARTVARKLGCDLVLTDDPGKGSWSLGELPDNRWRQIRSTLSGLERVAGDRRATRVVRIRTDQIVDVPSIIRTVEAQQGDPRPGSVGQSDYIYVPGVFETVPYAIDDFYFAGAVADVLRFFAAQWDLRRCYRGVDSVHVDLVVKHVARNLRGVLPRRIRPLELFPVVDATRDLDHGGRRGALGDRYLRLWSDVLALSLKPLPREVYETVVFRGVPYRSRFGRMFLDDWLACQPDPGEFFRSRHGAAFTHRAYGALGLLLNYAPECAALDRGGLPATAARAVHALRRARSGRYRGRQPQPLT